MGRRKGITKSKRRGPPRCKPSAPRSIAIMKTTPPPQQVIDGRHGFCPRCRHRHDGFASSSVATLGFAVIDIA